MAAEKAAAAAASDDGSNYSYGGIVCGIVAFFLFTIPLAILAIILGAVGFSKGDKTKGIIAIIIGVIMLGLGVLNMMLLMELGLI